MIRSRSPKTRTAWLVAALMLAPLGCGENPVAPDAVRDAETPAETLTVGLRLPMRIHASVQPIGPLDPLPGSCLAGFHTAITGEAMHLGDFQGVGTTCITSQVAPDPDPPFTAPGPPPYLTAAFFPQWVLTSASGDELWLEGLDGVAVISLVDNSLRAQGGLRIIGGTGRFEGATGSVAARAVNETGLGPDRFGARGWIQLAGVNRSAR